MASAVVKRYSNSNSLFQNSGRRYLCTQTKAFGCVTCYIKITLTTHAQINKGMPTINITCSTPVSVQAAENIFRESS